MESLISEIQPLVKQKINKLAKVKCIPVTAQFGLSNNNMTICFTDKKCYINHNTGFYRID